jgi:hypothetical protein
MALALQPGCPGFRQGAGNILKRKIETADTADFPQNQRDGRMDEGTG